MSVLIAKLCATYIPDRTAANTAMATTVQGWRVQLLTMNASLARSMSASFGVMEQKSTAGALNGVNHPAIQRISY
jgi:hypothetical protein